MFDDFYHLDAASRLSTLEILFEKSTNVFRPTAFIAWKLEFAAGGWNAPWVPVAASIAIHGASALLFGLILRELTRRDSIALVSAAAFLVSPWSTEAYLWARGQMDALACLFALASLFACTKLWGATTRRATSALAVLVALFFASALGAKESAIAAPALLVCFFFARSLPSVSARRMLLSATALAVGTLFYVVLRMRVVPLFRSEYGSFGSMLAGASLFENIRRYISAFSTGIPLPSRTSAWMFLYRAGALTLLAGSVLQRHKKLVALLACAWILSFLPVAWADTSPYSSQAGRFRYLPALFACTLYGLGFDGIRRSSRFGPACALAAALSFALAATRSVAFQSEVWLLSGRMARAALEQFLPFVGTRMPAVAITNLPHDFSAGPFGLKAYAFRLYYRGRETPPVRARTLKLTYQDSGPLTVWAVGNDSDGQIGDGGPAAQSLTFRFEREISEPANLEGPHDRIMQP